MFNIYQLFLSVIAHDKDIGNNGEVRYSFGSDAGELLNVFAVDAYTGWITTLVQLDKEKQSEFVFQIFATDNGNPKQFSRTHVYLKLQDYNDNPPQFTSRHYEAAGKCAKLILMYKFSCVQFKSIATVRKEIYDDQYLKYGTIKKFHFIIQHFIQIHFSLHCYYYY